jgi:hypothetical protein
MKVKCKDEPITVKFEHEAIWIDQETAMHLNAERVQLGKAKEVRALIKALKKVAKDIGWKL